MTALPVLSDKISARRTLLGLCAGLVTGAGVGGGAVAGLRNEARPLPLVVALVGVLVVAVAVVVYGYVLNDVSKVEPSKLRDAVGRAGLVNELDAAEAVLAKKVPESHFGNAQSVGQSTTAAAITTAQASASSDRTIIATAALVVRRFPRCMSALALLFVVQVVAVLLLAPAETPDSGTSPPAQAESPATPSMRTTAPAEIASPGASTPAP